MHRERRRWHAHGELRRAVRPRGDRLFGLERRAIDASQRNVDLFRRRGVDCTPDVHEPNVPGVERSRRRLSRRSLQGFVRAWSDAVFRKYEQGHTCKSRE